MILFAIALQAPLCPVLGLMSRKSCDCTQGLLGSAPKRQRS